MGLFGLLGGFWEASWGVEATSSRFGVGLGPSWGRLGAILVPPWAALGSSWASLGRLLELLGALLGPSGALLEARGVVLGPSLGGLGRLQTQISEMSKPLKNHKEN